MAEYDTSNETDARSMMINKLKKYYKNHFSMIRELPKRKPVQKSQEAEFINIFCPERRLFVSQGLPKFCQRRYRKLDHDDDNNNDEDPESREQ